MTDTLSPHLDLLWFWDSGVTTTVTNVHPNSMLGVWAYHSYNKWNGTFNGYWYVGHLEGDGYKL
jgi:hypothetical protein